VAWLYSPRRRPPTISGVSLSDITAKHATPLVPLVTLPGRDPLYPSRPGPRQAPDAMASHREAVQNDKDYVDPNPLPPSVPHVDELGTTSAPLKSASFFIGDYCREVNGEYPRSGEVGGRAGASPGAPRMSEWCRNGGDGQCWRSARSRVRPSARRAPRLYSLRMAAGVVGCRRRHCPALAATRPALAQRTPGSSPTPSSASNLPPPLPQGTANRQRTLCSARTRTATPRTA
jgi:hypothetical protein